MSAALRMIAAPDRVALAPLTEVIVGEQQERKTAPSAAEQPKAGWLARWRERRRQKSARAADISRRALDVDRRNRENFDKYGAGR